MDRPVKTLVDAHRLLQTAELITKSVGTIIAEWSKETAVGSSASVLPSQDLFQAQRTIIAATGVLTEIVSEPHVRVIELACQYWESRALFLATERRIADLLASAPPTGVPLAELARKTGVEAGKLGRVLRCLTSAHVFAEPAPDVFANNVVSASLVGNEQLRAYVMLFALDLYTTSDHMPRYLLGAKGHSYAVNETAFQEAIGTSKTRWEWLEETLPVNGAESTTVVTATDAARDNPAVAAIADASAPCSSHGQPTSGASHLGPGIGYPGLPSPPAAHSSPNGGVDQATDVTGAHRPEHAIFGLAMIGGGKVTGVAHLYDYPWAELGEATVVDVGGGVGGFCIQLGKLYPDLRFVLQDRAPVLDQAKRHIWPRENPSALALGKVTFLEHDFFQPNPTSGADVYWLRYVLHDWSDDYCIKILQTLRPALTKSSSRILVCDQVMDTTLGCPELQPAPSPLPANYGYFVRYSHHRDMSVMSVINGIERTPQQWKDIVTAAGLRLVKIWPCRSQVPILEIRAVEDHQPV